MAHFYAEIQGAAKGKVSRTGTKNSSISASVNGWNCGVDVAIVHHGGTDFIKVYLTTGSKGDEARELCRVSENQAREFIAYADVHIDPDRVGAHRKDEIPFKKEANR